ncbi:MAG: 3-deoxy-7-phosphoheptulonate synthase, partial [Gammaproteobacteria bacterium]|nr:3-deoxy-7-phosphoheptulonate synthase [Gammaproteobacteria bacterium]
MLKDSLNNIHISSEEILVTPQALKQEIPVSDPAIKSIKRFRQQISDIIHHRDHRLLVICGPCSIHDIESAKEYALRLKKLSTELSDSLYIVMRVYFE